MDAVNEIGTVGVPPPALKRTDGYDVRQRVVEGVENGETTATHTHASALTRGDALVQLVRNSAEGFEEMLATSAEAQLNGTGLGQLVDTYA